MIHIGTGCRLHPHEWADEQVAVQDREIDDACDTFFTTRDGRRLYLQSDLFGEPTVEEIQAYEPAADADKWYGLHVDEFFDWMDCHADMRQEFIQR